MSLRAGLTAGILGGGQLARMLAQAGARLGLEVVVLSEEAGAPATQVCPDVVLGSLTDEAALRSVFSRARLVTFENEFVDGELLRRAADGGGGALFPSLAAIAVGQDKLRQKALLTRLGIPTAAYVAHDGRADLDRWIGGALDRFGGSAVFKWAAMGYDGKGVLAVRDGPAERARARSFCAEALARNLTLYAEQRIAFRRELAIVSSYSTSGEFAAYPLVVTEQRDGICFRAYGPAVSYGTAPEQEALARSYARRLAQALGLVGTSAIELFETEDRALVVNEIAPRVHNSGHYTQDAAATSQFENHWRAILGLPLGDVRPAPGFAMQNLLGPDGVSIPAARVPLPAAPAHVHLHWYGKKEIRPGRKLGHLNGAVAEPSRLPGLLEELDALRASWEDGARALASGEVSPLPRGAGNGGGASEWGSHP